MRVEFARKRRALADFSVLAHRTARAPAGAVLATKQNHRSPTPKGTVIMTEKRETDRNAASDSAADQWPEWLFSQERDQGELVQDLGSYSTTGWSVEE